MSMNESDAKSNAKLTIFPCGEGVFKHATCDDLLTYHKS